MRRLLDAINEATEAIPGWDEYARTGVAKELWDGTLPGDDAWNILEHCGEHLNCNCAKV